MTAIRMWKIEAFLHPIWNTNNFDENDSPQNYEMLLAFQHKKNHTLKCYNCDFEIFCNMWLYPQFSVNVYMHPVKLGTVRSEGNINQCNSSN